MKVMDVFSGTAAERALSDFDLIEEIIIEEEERSDTAFPRPRPPPADLLPQTPCGSQHARMHRQGPSRSSQPVLVARGTAHPPTPSLPQSLRLSNSKEMSSAPTSRTAASRPPTQNVCQGLCADPGGSADVSSQARANAAMLERILEKPWLVVVEEPKDRGMRFRYECEGRSAGSILGVSSTDSNKTQPAIEIQGPIDFIKMVTVTVSLVTKDLPHRPHPHCLVGKDCPPGSGICLVTINPHSNRCHSFANLGIQCVRRKELDLSLQKRMSQNIDPFQTGHSKGIEDLDMNAVRLCFQCELQWEDGRKDSLSPVLSSIIYDKKATTTSQLKITCLNQERGSCTGKTEIYMLCDKVQKDDIEIVFRRGLWKANGEFAQTDVHRQIAIVFKTPPYQDQNITDELEVSVALRRISDQMESEPVAFTYLPHNPDPYEVKRKCRIKSDISFREKPCLTAVCAPAAEQPFHFQQPQSATPSHTWPDAGQPAAPALGDACCGAALDQGCSLDEQAFLNHLMEIANADEGLGHNPAGYSPDFSQYSDQLFNMLVNENMQSELQDGQVKQEKRD